MDEFLALNDGGFFRAQAFRGRLKDAIQAVRSKYINKSGVTRSTCLKLNSNSVGRLGLTEDLWERARPKALCAKHTNPSIQEQLNILALTSLHVLWLFLGIFQERTCIGCISRPRLMGKQVRCESIYDLPSWRIIDDFFGCVTKPEFYEPRRADCKDSYVRRMQKGDVPDIGLQCSRVYWECQAKMKLHRMYEDTDMK